MSYTWSKLIDTASSVFDASILAGPVANFPVADSYNPRLERDVSTGDIPHNLVASFVWDLPWGRGRRFEPRGLAGVLAGRLAARRHRDPAVGRAHPDHPGDELQRVRGLRHPAAQPHRRSRVAFFGSQRRRGGSTPAPSRWRRSSRWATARATRCAVPATGTSTSPSSSGRRIGRGRTTLELRVEAFNLTNTPPLGAPNGVLGSPGFGSITSAGDPQGRPARPEGDLLDEARRLVRPGRITFRGSRRVRGRRSGLSRGLADRNLFTLVGRDASGRASRSCPACPWSAGSCS